MQTFIFLVHKPFYADAIKKRTSSLLRCTSKTDIFYLFLIPKANRKVYGWAITTIDFSEKLFDD